MMAGVSLRVVLALIAVIVMGSGCRRRASDGSAVRISAVPDENPTRMQRKYVPLVRFLEKALGRKVIYVPVVDYGAAVQAMIAGKLDFVWLGGFTHVQARNMAKVEPLVMRGIDRLFKSVVIVGENSGVTRVSQLRGRRFAFGSKSSTSGHLMPRYYLKKNHGIDAAIDFKGRPIFSGAHDATAKLVESGRVAAGALNAVVWKRLVRTGKVDLSKVRVLWITPSYVDYVWTARTSVDAELRRKFSRAFLSLSHRVARDRQILALQGAKRFVAATSKDFDAVEKIARTVGLLKL